MRGTSIPALQLGANGRVKVDYEGRGVGEEEKRQNVFQTPWIKEKHIFLHPLSQELRGRRKDHSIF